MFSLSQYIQCKLLAIVYVCIHYFEHFNGNLTLTRTWAPQSPAHPGLHLPLRAVERVVAMVTAGDWLRNEQCIRAARGRGGKQKGSRGRGGRAVRAKGQDKRKAGKNQTYHVKEVQSAFKLIITVSFFYIYIDQIVTWIKTKFNKTFQCLYSRFVVETLHGWRSAC